MEGRPSDEFLMVVKAPNVYEESHFVLVLKPSVLAPLPKDVTAGSASYLGQVSTTLRQQLLHDRQRTSLIPPSKDGVVVQVVVPGLSQHKP